MQEQDATIFCPACDELILESPVCPGCGWQRPIQPGMEPGQELWRWSTGGRVRPAMAVGGGKVVVGSDEGLLLALDAASGREVWRSELDDWFVSPEMVISGERIFVGAEPAAAIGTCSKALRAFSLADGSEEWCYPVEALRVSSPCLWEGRLYAGSSDGLFHAVGPESGERLWAVEIGGWGPGAPVPFEGGVLYGTAERFVVALDGETGEEIWQFDAGEEAGRLAPILAVEQDICYVAAGNGRVYVLDAASGRLLDEWTLERTLLTRPVVVGDLLLVGGRGHRLWALNRHTGEEVWSLSTRRRIQVTPLVMGKAVYVGSDEGQVHAVDLKTGEPRWEQPFAIEGKVRAMAADEDRLYVGVHALRIIPSNTDSTPEGLRPRGVQTATYEGEVIALLYRPQAPKILAPSTYARRRDFEMAGVSAALRGEFRQAGRFFERAGRLAWAGRLYEEAGEWERAAAAYESADRLEDAERCYLQGGQMGRVGELQEAAGRCGEAARAYGEAGDLLSAARNYEQAGELATARDLYREVEDTEGYLRTTLALGETGPAAEALEAEGRMGEAGDLWRELKNWQRAGRCYEQGGQWDQAADMWIQAGDLGRAGDAYRQAGNLRALAAALEKQGRWLEAAQVREEAVQQLEGSLGRGREAGEQLAEAHEVIAGLYERAFEWDEVRRCRRRVLFFRQLPILDVQAEGSFVCGGWNELIIRVRNSGFGVARNVRVQVSGRFDQQPSPLPSVPGLRPEQEEKIQCYVKPSDWGPRVPLTIKVCHDLPDGTPAEPLERTEGVHVANVEQDRRYTPIHIGGDFIGGDQVRGDMLGAGAQKGDRLEIRRGGGGREISVEREGAPEAVRCPQCGRTTRKGKFCMACGARLGGGGD